MRKKTMKTDNGHYYLLNKAFRTSLTAALLSSMINNICSTTDALITGNMIGPEALGSIGLAIPIITALNCFMDLMFDGAIARSSTDLGNHDISGMNRRLSAGLVSGYVLTLAAMIVLQIALVPLSRFLAPDNEVVRRGFVDYMRITAGFYVVQSLLAPIPKIIRAIGNPVQATRILMIVSVGNVFCDLIFIRLFRMEIAGSAMGTAGGWILCAPYAIYCIRRNENFRLVNPLPYLKKYIPDNIGAGLPGVLSSILTSVMGLVVNGAVVRTAGSIGLSVMTVGIQLSSIAGAAAFGLRKSMQLVGGLLQGEKDAVSLRYLFVRVLRLTMISVAAAAAVVLLIPEPIMQLFGVKDPSVLTQGAAGLRTYIIFLIPLYFTVTYSVVYQIQKHYTLATVISALPVLLVICFAEIFSRANPDLFWWSFFLGGIINAGVQLTAAACIWKKQKNCCYPSLIPRQDEEPSLLISSAYTEEDTQKALREAEAFLKEQKIGKKTADQALLCMDEIFHNIIQHAKVRKKGRKKGYYNARFRIGQSLYVTVRDDGIPFNPVLTEESLKEWNSRSPEAAPGLRIINRMNSEITYSFVCSQNMLQLRWDL